MIYDWWWWLMTMTMTMMMSTTLRIAVPGRPTAITSAAFRADLPGTVWTWSRPELRESWVRLSLWAFLLTRGLEYKGRHEDDSSVNLWTSFSFNMSTESGRQELRGQSIGAMLRRGIFLLIYIYISVAILAQVSAQNWVQFPSGPPLFVSVLP